MIQLLIDKTNLLIPKTVRTILGLAEEDQTVLSDSVILNDIIVYEAEQMIYDFASDLKGKTSFTIDEIKKIEVASVNIISAILCGSMANRLEIEVKTIDVTWKKKNIDYELLEQSLLVKAQNVLESLNTLQITDKNIIFQIAPSNRAVNEE